MHQTAVETDQIGRMHGAVGAVTAAAAVLPKQRLALLGERLMDALFGEPARVIGRLHDDDFALHRRVLGAAILGAFERCRCPSWSP